MSVVALRAAASRIATVPVAFDIATYLPYLSLGLIVWQAFSSIITEGCETFLREQSVIQQVPIPFSIHAYRVVYRNFIVFAHNLVIVPLGLVIFEIPLDWSLLGAVAGCVVLAVNGSSVMSHLPSAPAVALPVSLPTVMVTFSPASAVPHTGSLAPCCSTM